MHPAVMMQINMKSTGTFQREVIRKPEAFEVVEFRGVEMSWGTGHLSGDFKEASFQASLTMKSRSV
ncbi:MAG TPA: hypothetical protein DGU45_08755 [Planctomycetes bacterium]|nr:hypothetical protein [Planctomycetota bacterium]